MSKKIMLINADHPEECRAVLLDKGRVLDIGPHDELVARNEYYAKVVSLQFV